MAVPTGTLETYQLIGEREDLTDMIYMIDPTDTPLLSAIERGEATHVLH